MLTQQSSSTVGSVLGKLVREAPFLKVVGSNKHSPLFGGRGVGCKSLPSWFGERMPGWFVHFLAHFSSVKNTNLRIVYLMPILVAADLMLRIFPDSFKTFWTVQNCLDLSG